MSDATALESTPDQAIAQLETLLTERRLRDRRRAVNPLADAEVLWLAQQLEAPVPNPADCQRAAELLRKLVNGGR